LGKKYQIQVLSHEKRIHANPNQPLLEALIDHGILLRSDCGGKGKCGKCRVQIQRPTGHFEESESCTHRVTEHISIKIPESSLLSPQIMGKASVVFPPGFKKLFQHVQTGDAYGIAADLGTTTIAIYLCNKTRGEVIASLSVKNPQAMHGDDVMSRIGAIGQVPQCLGKMQKLVVNSIEWGIKEVLAASHLAKNAISEMVVVGNPTMIHILAGVDPKPIGISPYQPAFHTAKKFRTDKLGFGCQDVLIQTLPQVSGFIGGDILAAALGVDLENQPDGTLLIDLGTNGELLLKSAGGLYATSCATGPAFEGATLSCGMQALPGAIRSGGKKVMLVPENIETGQAPVFISQKDIRSVQLGKSALITGIQFLLQKAELDKPAKIIIAGAFGSHLGKADMLATGMLPDVGQETIEMAGNSAGTGAIMTLCHNRYLQKAIQLATQITIIELACNVDFQERFVKNLSFPTS